jgi:collagen type III alpha
MAAVLEPKQDPAGKFASRVDEQVAEAASRIRVHDLTFGGLVLLALLLAYTAGMILLDKYLVLPESVRQLSLAAFVLIFAGAGYWTVVRPLRRRINPLYAAVQVERTVEDAKNSVAGYVEAREREDVHPTVRAAMGARAAKAAGKADLNRAVDHRTLVYAGAIGVALFLALVVLFFVFRPAQFTSLVGRTFVPFSSDPIATRTRLTLTKPEGGDVTITAGQSVTIGVHVGGQVPNPDGPDRVRVLLRHNPADPAYEPIPMEPGESSRDWQVRVPDYLVQNGFWYKVAAGDAVTEEYRVTVRSLPLVTGTEVTYEYPAYLRRKPETTKNEHLDGYPGTNVTLVVRTNREVRDGRLVIEPARQEVPGTPVPGRPDALRFELKLTESGLYRVFFTSKEGEKNTDPPSYGIKVLTDYPPRVEIVRPEEDDTEVPANGQLAVDATVGDDFGIDKVTLRMRLQLEGGATRLLADRPFEGGKSFLREKDNTWPTSLEYKDSMDLAKLTDSGGNPVALKEGMVIEYWLEAIDNCSEAKPAEGFGGQVGNVGKSKVKRIRVTPPKTDPDDRQKLDEQKQQRRNEEAQHNKEQQQRLDTENRDQPKQQDAQPEKKGGDPGAQKEPGKTDVTPQKKDGTEGKKDETPMPGGMGQPDKPDNPMPGGTPDSKKQDAPMAGGPENTPPKDKTETPKGGMPPDTGSMGEGNPETAPLPTAKEDNELQRKADRVQQQLNQQRQGGEGKPNPSPTPEERTEPGDPKPNPDPKAGGEPGKAEPKAGPQPNDPANPAGGTNAAQSRPPGNVEQPPQPSEPKPDPQADPMQPQGQPAESRPQPKNGNPGEERPAPQPKKGPEGGMPEPKDAANRTEDPSGGGAGRPATQRKQDGTGEPMTDPMPRGPEQKSPQDPTADAGKPKPMPKQDRGAGRDPATQPGDDQQPPDAGTGRPQTAPEAATNKPTPKDGPQAGNPPTEPKPTPGGMDMMDPSAANPPGASARQPEPKDAKDTKDPKGGGLAKKGVEPGEERKTPDANAQAGNTAPQPKDKTEAKSGGASQKVDPKEVADAARDLTNPDPKKQQEARQKLDNAVGEQNRKEIEKHAPNLNSPDKNTRAGAEKKVEEIANKAAQEQASKQPGAGTDPKQKIDPKQAQDIADAMKDLTNSDPARQKAAQEKLDKTIGPEARKQAEEIAKGLNSKDPKERAAAEQKLQDLQKKAEEFAKKDGEKGTPDPTTPPDKKGTEQANTPPQKQPGKGLTQEEIDELGKKFQDLTSDDKAKREAAEKEFDDKVGKENREKFQQAMKDAQSGDPQKAKEAQDKLNDLVKELTASSGGKLDERKETPKVAGPTTTKLNPAMQEDARNRLKSAELQLEDLKKVLNDPELQKQAGFESPEEYERFFKGFNEMVERRRKEVAALEQAEPGPAGPLPPPKGNISGGGKVEQRSAADSGAKVGGPTVAPPGYSEAQRKFQEAASKFGTPKK